MPYWAGMVDGVTSVTIDRPRAQVAAFACDPDAATVWSRNIKAARMLTPPPLRVGSRIAFTARFLGREIAYTYEVVDLVEGQRLVMRTADGPFPMETTYTWLDTAEGRTEMTLRNRGEPSGFSKVAAPAMAAAMRAANCKDLDRLKAIVESDRE